MSVRADLLRSRIKSLINNKTAYKTLGVWFRYAIYERHAANIKVREEACDRAGVPAGSIVCGASFRCFLVLVTFWPEPKNLLDTGVGLFARIFNLFRRFPLSDTPRGLRYPPVIDRREGNWSVYGLRYGLWKLCRQTKASLRALLLLYKNSNREENT